MGAPSPRAPQPDGSAPEAEDDDEAAAVEAKEPPPPPPPPSMSYENYGVDAKVGDALEALDVLGKWHSARVVQLEGEGMARTVLVHFPGWNAKRWDEWIQVGTGRLKPLGAPAPSAPPAQMHLKARLEATAAEDDEQPMAVEEEEEEEEDNEDDEPVAEAVAEAAAELAERDEDAAMYGVCLAAGDKLEAKDPYGNWYDAKVIGVRGEGETREVKVHYMGWKARFDEWVHVGTGRLKPEGGPSPPRPASDAMIALLKAPEASKGASSLKGLSRRDKGLSTAMLISVGGSRRAVASASSASRSLVPYELTGAVAQPSNRRTTHAKAAGARGGALGAGGGRAGGMCIVVLDELDQLVSRQQAILYYLFELAARPGSRLVLIGVANALDLIDHSLPRLDAKGAAPTLLKFNPYSHDELSSIIQQRLEPIEATLGTTLIDRMAVTFAAKKVAAASGDARRALEVCRVAADKAIAELKDFEERLPPPPSRTARAAPYGAPYMMRGKSPLGPRPSPLISDAERQRASTAAASGVAGVSCGAGAGATPSCTPSGAGALTAGAEGSRLALRPQLPPRLPVSARGSALPPSSVGSDASAASAASTAIATAAGMLPPPASASAASSAAGSSSAGSSSGTAAGASADVSGGTELLPAWSADPPIRFDHMKDALGVAFRSASFQLLKSLPHHQSLILCTMVLRMRRLTQQVRDEAARAAEAAKRAAEDAAEAAAKEACTREGPEAEAGAEADRGADAAEGHTSDNAVAKLAAAARGNGRGSGRTTSAAAAAAAAAASAAAVSRAAALAAATGGHERCTINMLSAEYDKLCAKAKLPALSRQELANMCENLAVCGLLGLGGATGRPSPHEKLQRAVWLCISQDDLELATSELRVFKQMLATS
jgi:Cdc6-like AAA superfamily ATPase